MLENAVIVAMPYRLSDRSLEQAVLAASNCLRSDYRIRIANDTLLVRRGWRTRQLFASLAGLAVFVGLLWACSIMFGATTHRLLPAWSLVTGIVLFVVGVPWTVLVMRPVGVRINRANRSVRGFGGTGRFDGTLGSTAIVRLSRTLDDERTGSGTIELVDGDTSWTVLDVEGARSAQLTRLKLLAIAIGAWIGVENVEKTDANVLDALEPTDKRIGLYRRQSQEVSVVDIVVAAIELVQNLD